MLSYFVLAMVFRFSTASVTVYENESASPLRLDASTMHYFGPQTNVTLVRVPLLFLSNEKLRRATRSLLANKVIATNYDTFEMSETYRRLQNHGALGLILLQTFPAGVNVFHHDHWKQNAFIDGKVVVACVSVVDITSQTLERWRSSSLSGAAVDISSPFDRGYYRLFTSPLWLAIFQILMPLFNYYTAASGMVEAKRIAGLEGAVSPRKLSARRLAMFILMLESSSCFIFGTSLILGNYGPTMLPSVFHRAMFSGLMTPSLITTLVMALHMHEESRGVNNLERRPVFNHYRRMIVLSAIIFCIWGEIGYILLTIIPARYFLPLRKRVAGASTVCMAITQFGLAVFFISKSKHLAKSVSEYMVHPGDSDVRVKGVKTLRRLKYWGFAASGAMIVNSLALLLLLSLFSFAAADILSLHWKLKSPMFYFSLFLTMAMSRTAVSLAQVRTHDASFIKKSIISSILPLTHFVCLFRLVCRFQQ